jgi:hypothetical protein
VVPPTSVHFNGSVNLADATTVMREISARIPHGVRRMTDGETGERSYWIHYQIEKFLAMPEFESVSVSRAYETEGEAPPMHHLRLADGASADMIQWPNLGYADEYAKSFEIFDRLQRDGTIAAGVRFQMQYPTPLASIAGSIVPDDMPAVGVSYEAALFADVDKALTALRHDRVAVQWDVAVEFGLLEGAFGPRPALPMDQITPGLVRCIERVPGDVPVGMHLCYGDYGHQHFKQPESLKVQVDLVNAVVASAGRPLNFVAFTVPQDRSDAGYFAPLSGLRAGAETELYFSLVPYHPADQPASTTAEQVTNIDGALSGRAWGICTECGMGRVASEDVGTLLDLHRQTLD